MTNAAKAVLELLLVTPLTFLESRSLFAVKLCSCVAMQLGTLAMPRLLSRPSSVRTEILLVGILVGGTLAGKALTFSVVPVLALLVVLGIYVVSYITAFMLTGNPVFPFFNVHFKSPLYPPKNFRLPGIFECGVAWGTLYRMTFDSGKYLGPAPRCLASSGCWC